jgi:hypothetical protein
VQVLGEAFECERIFQTDVISGMEAPRLEADFIGVLPNLKLCGLFYPGRVVDAIVLTRAGSLGGTAVHLIAVAQTIRRLGLGAQLCSRQGTERAGCFAWRRARSERFWCD